MIRKAVIISLATLAVVTLTLWITSYSYEIWWRNKRYTQLPVLSIGLDEGQCELARLRHVDQLPNEPTEAVAIELWTFAKCAIFVYWCVTLDLPDHPPGFTIRRVEPPFILHGQWVPVSQDVQSVTLKDVKYTAVVVRLWLPTAILGAYPGIAFIRGTVRRWRRQRRRRKGWCVWCGYDLTGNVTSICPECGERNSRLRESQR